MDRTQIDEIDDLISVDMNTIENNMNGFSELIEGHLANIQRLATGTAPNPLPMTEQQYLDLANTTKEIIAEKDRKMLTIKLELQEYKYTLYKIYGLTSFVGSIMNGMDGTGGVEDTMAHNLEYANSEMEDLFRKSMRKN